MRTPAALALMLTMGVLFVVSFLCPIFFPVAFVAYFYMSWRLAVAPSVLVLEKLGVLQSMRRSWDLSQGGFWRWVGVSFLTFVMMLGFSMTLGGMDTLEARDWLMDSLSLPRPALELIFVLISALLAGLATAFSAAAQTVYYLDLRMRRDGLDLLMRLDRLSAIG